MKALSATLEAAQKQASSLPYVQAVLEDIDGRLDRFRFQRVYTGAEMEDYAAAVIAGDGSLIRARLDAGTLYTSRIASPVAGSTFGSWTSHGAIASAGAGVALAAFGSDVYLFYVHTDDRGVRMKVSSDNGQTYGSPVTIATAASAVTHLAAAVSVSGERVAFWSVGAAVWRSRFASGSWGTAAVWTKTVHAVTGIAATWSLDFKLVVTGEEDTTENPKVWATEFGDGFNLSTNTWGPLVEITSASSGSDVSFHTPGLTLASSGWRLFFLEKFTGLNGWRRLYWSALDATDEFSDPAWREPVPFDHSPAADHGIAAAFGDANLWLVAGNGVWLAALDSIEPLDVSADVVAAAVDLEERGGRAKVELRNEDGRYTTHPSIARGMRLALAPGYCTSAGPEAAAAWWFWVESVELLTGPRPRVALHCRDAWWLLERWQARRQFSWPAGDLSVFNLLTYVMARAGLRAAATDASPAMTGFEPAFTIHPGDSGDNVAQRLLDMVPDVLYIDQSTGRVIEPEADDATSYAYGDEEHAIVEGRYLDSGPLTNRARVVGFGDVTDDAFDFDDIEATGERPSQTIDLNLNSGARVTNRAAYELQDAQLREIEDELRIFGVNCGQELYDVVEVTDPAAGLEAAPRRVLGLSWRYETSRRPRYDMTLRLGRV